MNPKKTILYIEVRQEGFFYNDTECVSFDNSNLSNDIVRFSIQSNHFLKCKMISYDKKNEKLLLEISNYKKYDRPTFIEQKAKLPISKIEFVNISLDNLKPLVVYYNLDKIRPYLSNDPLEIEEEKEAFHKIAIKVNLSKVQFLNGKVRFKHSLSWYKDSAYIEIPNVNILKEYEFIKPYFSKMFGRKSIDAFVECKSRKDGINFIRCFSPQIDRINKGTINVLKTHIYTDFSKKRQQVKPGSLMTIDDLLLLDSNESFGNIDISEKEMLFTLLKDKNVRNFKELYYLANEIQTSSLPIYINLMPNIGFVFVYKGVEMNHFIWELLDSNATYVWGVSKSLGIKKSIKKIEQEIALIKSIGRTSYKQEQSNTSSLYFNYLIHKTSKSEIDDPFPLWIAKLHELLI